VRGGLSNGVSTSGPEDEEECPEQCDPCIGSTRVLNTAESTTVAIFACSRIDCILLDFLGGIVNRTETPFFIKGCAFVTTRACIALLITPERTETLALIGHADLAFDTFGFALALFAK